MFVCWLLPSDSPPCSLPRPTAAAAPPRRSSEVGPAPDLRRHEETRTMLKKEARSSLRGEHMKMSGGAIIWNRVKRGSAVLIAVNSPDYCSRDTPLP